MFIKTFYLVIFLACCAVIVTGCNNPSTVGPDPSAAAPKITPKETEGSGGDYPRFAIKRIEPDGTIHEETGNAVLPEVLQKEFQQIDWNKRASKPSLAVELDVDNSLKIALSPDATENEGLLIAVWARPGPELAGATSKIVRRSKPLRDGDQALTLLNAFAKGDENFESLVEWEIDAPAPGN